MKQKINIFELWHSIVRNTKDLLYMERELTDNEKLENLKKNNKENQRLLDIKAIRDSGDYVPDYNKPKKYTDYKLFFEATEKDLYVDRFFRPVFTEKLITKIVSPETKTNCERPESFVGKDGSFINAVPFWLDAVRKSNDEEIKFRHLKELQTIQHSQVREEYYSYILHKFMNIC